MELLGRGREIVACFIALLCVTSGYSKRCYVVNNIYLNPARFSRTLKGVVSRLTCMITCLEHDLCQGVYHDRLSGTCSHYDIDKVFYDRRSNLKTHPNGAIAMIHCDRSALRVVLKSNSKFMPINDSANVKKGCLDIGGTRLASEGELAVLLSNGFSYNNCGWIVGGKRLLKKANHGGRILYYCYQATNIGYCKL